MSAGAPDATQLAILAAEPDGPQRLAEAAREHAAGTIREIEQAADLAGLFAARAHMMMSGSNPLAVIHSLIDTLEPPDRPTVDSALGEARDVVEARFVSRRDELVATLITEAGKTLAAADTVAGLTTTRPDLLGKSSRLSRERRHLGSLPPEDRPAAGRALGEARAEVEARYEARLDELRAAERRRQLEAERLDLTELHEPPPVGRLHVITQTQRRLEDVFCAMGYTVAEGPEIETEWHNFGALNFPPGHPARDMYDTLYVDHGTPGSTLLRTHTSPVQVRVMQTQSPPLYVVAPGRCYRQDTADATHMPVFHQIEGLVVDEGITLGDLAGAIETFTTAYFGPGFTSRLRPSYFPFTEPSAEFDVQRPDGTWLELGGSGMVHPSVLGVCGVDPERWSGFAFGFGIDRLAMLRYGIDDLRDLWTNDVRFLEQF